VLCLIAGTSVKSLAQAPEYMDLKLKDLSGRIVRLSDYKGKVVLLNFWATWCPPCRAEVPELVKLQKEYWNRGLRIIGITYPPTNRGEVRRFVRDWTINYPILAGTQKTKALFYKGETLPITVIVDRTGRVHELIEGILLPEEFEEIVRPLLETKASPVAHANR